MRVDQATGGTNQPGVSPDAFAMPAGLRMRYDLPGGALATCVSGYAIYICDDRTPMDNWFLPAPGMIVVLLDAGPMDVQFRTRRQVDLPQASVWGPTTHAFRTTTRGGMSVGIGLTAEGWSRRTRQSARRACDRVSGLDAVIGADAATRLLAALQAVGDDAAIAPLLDRLLPPWFDRADPDDLQVRALDRLVHDPAVTSAEELAARLGMNSRALRQLATERMGMPVKTLLTRARFVRSYAAWLKGGRRTGYDGIDSGYFDDAHFLRDARHFLNSIPRRLDDLETIYLRTSMRARAAVFGAPAHVLHKAG